MGFHPACGHRLPYFPSFMLKAGFVQANMQPGLGQLSGVTSFQNQNIVMHGNPTLTSCRANQTMLAVIFHNKWLNVNLSYDYFIHENPINYYYQYEQPYIAYACSGQ